MTNVVPPQIGVAAVPERLFLAFRHRATHEVSLAAETLVTDYFAVSTAEDFRIVLDLRECDVLDSTFAGWMLKLRRRCTERRGGVVVSGCSASCRGALDVMGLSELFPQEAAERPGELQWSQLPGIDEGDPEAIEFMLGAHEDLADVNDNNRRVFRPIAELLRRELERRQSSE